MSEPQHTVETIRTTITTESVVSHQPVLTLDVDNKALLEGATGKVRISDIDDRLKNAAAKIEAVNFKIAEELLRNPITP